jgi:hypothetical protein
MRIRWDNLPFIGAGLLVAIGLLMLAAKGVGQHAHQPATPPVPGAPIAMPPDRADDSYAIYSMLMPGETFSSMAPDQAARWAIADVTVSLQDRNPAVPPQGQLKPPTDNVQAFNEAVSDYDANRNVRVQLTTKPFRISHDFTLLAPDQVNALRGSKAAGAYDSSETRSQWAGYPGITFFSEVYFDSKHGAALVYMNDWCAHLCAAGSWIYLEKQGGHWVRRSGITSGGA